MNEGRILTLEEFIKEKGYTVEDFNKTVDMLCSKGIANGCYQDYTLLTFVLEWLSNIKQEIVV